MRFLLVYYFFSSLYFFNTKAVAQVDLFPKHFGQVMLSKQLLNPAMPNMEQATNLTFSNRFFTGPFRQINNLYFIGNVNLSGQDSVRNVSSVGVKFTNEKAGEFVERPKYFASYSFRTRLNDVYWLGLGLDLGRSAYIFKGTDVSTSGSDSNWDGNVGIVFHSESFCLGGSANQMFNTLIAPKDLYFRWRRFYALYAEKTLYFGTSELSIFTQNQFLPLQEDVWDVGANLVLTRVLLLGSNVWVGRSVSFLAGLKNISLDEHHFSLYMSYNIPAFNQTSANIQSFELSLYYQFR